MRVYHTSHCRPSGAETVIISVTDGEGESLTALIEDFASGATPIELTYVSATADWDEQRLYSALTHEPARDQVLRSDLLGPGSMYLDEQTLGRALMQIAQGI